MLSVLLASVLVQQGEPEHKLLLKVFEDFANDLVKDSGYKLDMSKTIAGRPVVFYFGNPGDGISDLVRACDELDLGCYIDPERKKIFINGPLDRVSEQIRVSALATILNARKQSATELDLQASAVKELDELLRQLGSDNLSNYEKSIIHGKAFSLEMQLNPISRVQVAQLLDIQPEAIATQLSKSLEHRIQVPLGSRAKVELAKLYEQGLQHGRSFDLLRNPDENERAEIAARKEKESKDFFELISGEHQVTCWFKLISFDHLQITIEIASVERSKIFARSWVDRESKQEAELKRMSTKEMFRIFSDVMKNPDRHLTPGSVTINSIAEICFATRGNSVSWLLPPTRSLSFPVDSFNLETFDATISEDNWLRINDRNNLYPQYFGDWREVIGFINGTKVDGFTRHWLEEWLSKRSPERVVQAQLAIEPVRLFSDHAVWLQTDPLLVQAAILENIARGNPNKNRFKVAELSSAARRSFDLFFANEHMKEWYPTLQGNENLRKREQISIVLEYVDDYLSVHIESDEIVYQSPLKYYAVRIYFGKPRAPIENGL
ncbi:MAG: hypothetical protein KF836_00025 [Fimbriimonadaceae bacterium]|nr:hypothetical protein [Fimbriimonadaceae bacterium]